MGETKNRKVIQAVYCPDGDRHVRVDENCVTITPQPNGIIYSVEKKCEHCINFTMDKNSTSPVFNEITCSYEKDKKDKKNKRPFQGN